jgi:hypothetical protein
MYYSSMGPGAPGNFEGMQRATLGADMVGLNINTGGQDQNGNPQLAFDPYGSIQDLGRRNYGDLSADPFIKGPRPANSIIKAPHIDSPYMDEQLRRNFQPMRPPSAGPQLFPIRRVEGPGMQECRLHKVYLLTRILHVLQVLIINLLAKCHKTIPDIQSLVYANLLRSA